MRLYIWVTQDKYQLPLFVTDKVTEMARVSGVKAGSIYTITSKARNGKIKNPRFVTVDVEV